jgi:glycosyltransferase involved in cell wall biosynthesis
MGNDSKQATICIFARHPLERSETFIRAHVDRLPADVLFLYTGGSGRKSLFHDDDHPLAPASFMEKAIRWGIPMLLGSTQAHILTSHLRGFLKRHSVTGVLAEYGPQGVAMMEACTDLAIPLVVHFHGYDAYRLSVLDGVGRHYPEMFDKAAAIIAVSRHMEHQLLNLGAPREKLHYNVYGVDSVLFRGADPRHSPPVFVFVGRFVDKKAPYLTLSAFRSVVQAVPEARLVMIGDGYLRNCCERLASAYGCHESVAFLSPCSHEEVAAAMRRARAYVQHSLTADDGDSEGTPLSILEAGASGLPVVSTRHAGIPDVVLHDQTGYLVEEGDVDGMAEYMISLAQSPRLAGRLGDAAKDHIQSHFYIEGSIGGLWKIIQSVI